MAEAAAQTNENPTIAKKQLDELKGWIGQQIGKSKEQIDATDGKLEEALHELEKKAPKEIVEQALALAKGIESRLDEYEAMGQGLPSMVGGKDELEKALEDSEHLKVIRKNGGNVILPPRGAAGIKIPSLVKYDLSKIDIDSDTTVRSPIYRPGIVEYLMEASHIAQRVRKITIDDKSYSYIFERAISAGGGVVTTVDGAIVADAAATLVLADDGSVQHVGAGSRVLVERTDGSGNFVGYYRTEVLSVNKGTRTLTMTADIDVDIEDGDKISIIEWDSTDEGDAKPYTYIETDEAEALLKMIPIMAKTTRQALLTNSALRNFIETRMRRGINRSISRQMYYGSGSKRLQGFLKATSRQTYLWSDGVSKDTMADAVMRAGRKLPGGVAELMITADDWLKVISAKGTTGHYIHGKDSAIAVVNTPTLKSIGPYFAFEDSQLDLGDFLLNVPAISSELVSLRGSAQMSTGYVNDDYEKNILRMRYEEMLEHVILSYQGYVHGEFDSQPA